MLYLQYIIIYVQLECINYKFFLVGGGVWSSVFLFLRGGSLLCRNSKKESLVLCSSTG